MFQEFCSDLKMSLSWGKGMGKVSAETVCEVREKVNKLFPGAREQTKSYGNRSRHSGLWEFW